MTTFGLALTFLFSATALLSSQRIAALAVMAAVCYLTLGQNVRIEGFNFSALRLVLLAGFVRTILRRDLKELVLNRIDWVVIIFPAVVTLLATLRTGEMRTFVFHLGGTYDILMSYFIFRCLLSNQNSVQTFLHSLAFLIAPLAIFMVIESVVGSSLFAEFGGIGEASIRAGRLRCQGSFLGPITAGIFGATLVPMFLSNLRFVDKRRATICGVLSALVITYTSNSSGPLMALLSGLIGLSFWPVRNRMRMVRWGIVVTLLLFHIVMKSPVWFIFARLSDLVGGDGWHRSYLIDQAITYFSDWWLMGTSNTGDWMATKMSSGQADITNQYLRSGIDGGLAGLILFVLIIILCFKDLGAALKESRDKLPGGEFFFWCLCSALFAHVVTFFSVRYFDQMGVAWWALIAIISGTTSSVVRVETDLKRGGRSTERITEINPQNFSGEISGRGSRL